MQLTLAAEELRAAQDRHQSELSALQARLQRSRVTQKCHVTLIALSEVAADPLDQYASSWLDHACLLRALHHCVVVIPLPPLQEHHRQSLSTLNAERAGTAAASSTGATGAEAVHAAVAQARLVRRGLLLCD